MDKRVFQTIVDHSFQSSVRISLLLDVLAKINSSIELGDILQSIVEGAQQVMESEMALLWLYDENNESLILRIPAGGELEKRAGLVLFKNESITWNTFSKGESKVFPGVEVNRVFGEDFGSIGCESLISVPLFDSQKRSVGVLQAMNRETGPFLEDLDIPLFNALADQAAIAIEKDAMFRSLLNIERKNREQERKLALEQATSFAKGIEEERNRIARELHDGILGEVSTIIRKISKNQDQDRVSGDMMNLASKIREVMEGLNPGELSHFNLFDALEIMISRRIEQLENIPRFQVEMLAENPDFTEFDKVNIYRIFQEAIQNSIKYSSASSLLLKSYNEDQSLIIELSDDGVGFEEIHSSDHKTRSHYGLANMEYRASIIGAQIRLISAKDEGTLVRLIIPLRADQ